MPSKVLSERHEADYCLAQDPVGPRFSGPPASSGLLCLVLL